MNGRRKEVKNLGEIVVTGAKLQCMFGSNPGSLVVTSQQKCITCGKVAATIQDMQPNVNVPSFGMCSSLANPAVASATAAALGVLTPQPCSMVPAGTWVPVNPKILAGGKPCLFSNSQLVCGMGAGVITITSPGERKVTM
jgi:hypothetical protein